MHDGTASIWWWLRNSQARSACSAATAALAPTLTMWTLPDSPSPVAWKAAKARAA